MEKTSTQTANQSLLRHFIESETPALLGTLQVYVVRAGFVHGQGATLAAVELLNRVVVEALEHADRFRPTGQPRAWLLGIAANLIKREQAERARRERREPLVSDMVPDLQDVLSEDELFDRLATMAATDPGKDLERDDAVAAILGHVSERDQAIVRLAILHGLDGKAVAQELGIKPGAARVRLHRALNRLREALAQAENAEDGSHE
jgi:RNA polymerase sigma factor (sigma-70 family)